MSSAAYVIDIERAPDIVKALIEYLRPLDEHQAYHQLRELLRLFGSS
jgi:hypothetical protein